MCQPKMSGYECGDSQREKSQMMDYHMERIMYKPWFLSEIAKVYGETEPASPRDIRAWAGSGGTYFMRPGKERKYITLVFCHATDVLVLEQDSIDERGGVVRCF